MALITDAQHDSHDALYQCLVDLESELSADETRVARSALLLLLANQVGDLETVREAVALARAAATEARGHAPS